MNICDEFNSNCLVRACCSELCSKVGTLVDSYLNYHMDKEWMFYKLIDNGECPVCHRTMFWFTKYTPATNQGINIKMACDFCFATYRLTTYYTGDNKKTPEKLIQAYQGTSRGQVDNIGTIKQMKDYLTYKGDN